MQEKGKDIKGSKVTTDVTDITDELIGAFARAYVDEGKNALKACMQIWPGDINKALKMSAVLPFDEKVKTAVKEVEEHAMESLPSKSQYAVKLWEMIENATSDDARHKFLKLYADVRGFIEKPPEAASSNSQSVTVVLPRCIEVPTHGDDENWEQELAKQQTELMKRAKGRK